jgi:hypothetical protein
MPSCLNHQACLICTIHFSFKLGRWAARETDEDAGKEVKNANIGPKDLKDLRYWRRSAGPSCLCSVGSLGEERTLTDAWELVPPITQTDSME